MYMYIIARSACALDVRYQYSENVCSTHTSYSVCVVCQDFIGKNLTNIGRSHLAIMPLV